MSQQVKIRARNTVYVKIGGKQVRIDAGAECDIPRSALDDLVRMNAVIPLEEDVVPEEVEVPEPVQLEADADVDEGEGDADADADEGEGDADADADADEGEAQLVAKHKGGGRYIVVNESDEQVVDTLFNSKVEAEDWIAGQQDDLLG